MPSDAIHLFLRNSTGTTENVRGEIQHNGVYRLRLSSAYKAEFNVTQLHYSASFTKICVYQDTPDTTDVMYGTEIRFPRNIESRTIFESTKVFTLPLPL